MKHFLVFFPGILLAFSGTLPHPARAEEHRSLYAMEDGRPRRYNMDQVPFYRHYEDVRRYNAAPDRFGYQGYAMAPTVTATPVCPNSGEDEAPVVHPVKLRTIIVSRQSQPVSSYNACGSRISRTMVTTLYKDVYSNGQTRIWQHIAISDE